jgi:hypothetical protein
VVGVVADASVTVFSPLEMDMQPDRNTAPHIRNISFLIDKASPAFFLIFTYPVVCPVVDYILAQR